MRKNNNPCIECPPISESSDRSITCHSTCERYLNWKNEYSETISEINKSTIKENSINKYMASRVNLMRSRRSSNGVIKCRKNKGGFSK